MKITSIALAALPLAAAEQLAADGTQYMLRPGTRDRWGGDDNNSNAGDSNSTYDLRPTKWGEVLQARNGGKSPKSSKSTSTATASPSSPTCSPKSTKSKGISKGGRKSTKSPSSGRGKRKSSKSPKGCTDPDVPPNVSSQPSDTPSDQPSVSSQPSDTPSDQPSLSSQPSDAPSVFPSSLPSQSPSLNSECNVVQFPFNQTATECDCNGEGGACSKGCCQAQNGARTCEETSTPSSCKKGIADPSICAKDERSQNGPCDAQHPVCCTDAAMGANAKWCCVATVGDCPDNDDPSAPPLVCPSRSPSSQPSS